MSFVGTQRIMVSPKRQGILSLPLDRLAWYKSDYVYTLRVLYDGQWRETELVMSDQPVSSKYIVKTVNHKTLSLTPDHIQLTQRGQIKTSELTTDDFIQMNASADTSTAFHEDDAAYQTGITIGACFAIGDESNIEEAEQEADEEQLKYGVTTEINFIEFTKLPKYDLEKLIHFFCCGLLTMHRDAIETLRVQVDDSYYLDDYPRGSKKLDNNTIKILFNSHAMADSMGYYRRIKSFDWDTDYVYKRPLDESKGMLDGMFSMIPNSVTDDGNEICMPSDIMNCDLQQRLGLLDGLMINTDYDNTASTLYPHITLMMESMATLLSRQSMMFEETIYGIIMRVNKKESSDGEDEGESSEEYEAEVNIEEITKVYNINIFDMRCPKKLDEVETDFIGTIPLKDTEFSAGDETNEDGSYEREKDKIVILQVFKASKYEESDPPEGDGGNKINTNINKPTSSAGSSSGSKSNKETVDLGEKFTYGSSTNSEGETEEEDPPKNVKVNIKYYNYKAVEAINGTDYVIKDGKIYFRVSSVSNESCNEYAYNFKFDSASKQYFTLQNGVVVHI